MYLFFLYYPFEGIESRYLFSLGLPRCHNGFHGLIETAESTSAVLLTPQNPLPQPHWDCRILQTFLDIVLCWKLPFCVKIMLLKFLKDSAVSLKPLKPLLQSHWSRRSRFHGLIETAESASAVSLTPRKQLPRSHWDRWSWQFKTIILNFAAILRPYALARDW
jgi:hypothetical protein